MARGDADIGIVPVIEVARQNLRVLRGTGIACHGAVRSILLISKVPFGKIRTLAADSGSRTSVVLARVILSMRYSADPSIVEQAPSLPEMLDNADAALIIGDPALWLDPADLPFHVLDLGEEWLRLTGLPMVFAVWAARPDFQVAAFTEAAFCESYRFGARRLDEIVASEHQRHGVSAALAHEYLSRYIVFELGEQEHAGMRQFLKYAVEVERAPV